jgi:hypothetical protein
MVERDSLASLRNGLCAVLLLVAGACSSDVARESEQEEASSYIACEDPRPEICTRDFRPVCAERDTGIRCVTTPCPSSEWVLSPNACSACSESEVLGYRPGACAEDT